MVTSPALIVQGPVTPRATARPELAAPLTGNAASPKTLFAGTVRLTVCAALVADVDWCASGAGAWDASPAWEAVSAQVPVPLVIVTVVPALLHAPLEVTVTGSPELDTALTWNCEPKAAVEGAPVKVIVCVPAAP